MERRIESGGKANSFTFPPMPKATADAELGEADIGGTRGRNSIKFKSSGP